MARNILKFNNNFPNDICQVIDFPYHYIPKPIQTSKKKGLNANKFLKKEVRVEGVGMETNLITIFICFLNPKLPRQSSENDQNFSSLLPQYFIVKLLFVKTSQDKNDPLPMYSCNSVSIDVLLLLLF